MREICNYVKHYHTFYGNWGFGRKLSSGKGLNLLFAGPHGTGKTMDADIMANELGLDLYKIDLSAIVSKYIGETEKNLDRIFREGQNSNAIPFFDEADAIFGKRSEVRDSHDRYANIEVAYLLQKMDAYEGMVILATNSADYKDYYLPQDYRRSITFRNATGRWLENGNQQPANIFKYTHAHYRRLVFPKKQSGEGMLA